MTGCENRLSLLGISDYKTMPFQVSIPISEADYAHELETPVIPLLMQGDYKPDGWLRKITGKSYIDFSKNSAFDRAANELIDRLGSKGKMVR